MNDVVSDAKPLPLNVCIGWGIGTVGIFTFQGVTNVLFLRFMTDYLGVAAALGGTLIAVSRIYDAVTDPAMGVISDRTHSAWGRRRPYLLIGAVLCGLAVILLFNVPSFESPTSILIYIGLILVLYATAYTIFNVPYMAMPAEMTQDYHERSFLMSFRVYGIAGGSLVGGVAAPFLISSFGDGIAGHEAMSWGIGGFITISCLLCFHMTRHAPFTVRQDSERISLSAQFRHAVANKPFIRLLACKLLLMTAITVFGSTLAYFVVMILKTTYTWLGIHVLCLTLGLVLLQPLWLKVSRIHEKKTVYIWSAVGYTAMLLSWAISGPDEPKVFFIVRSLLQGGTAGGLILASQAMLPDTIEYDYRLSTLRREGIFSGLYTTIEKAAAALGVAVTGLFLGLMGYVESTEGQIVNQPDSALMAIVLCATVIPVVLIIFSCIAIAGYDLSQEKLKAAGTPVAR
jgi:GPH family glycoside/pentoside/hexuronide:cation symporter